MSVFEEMGFNPEQINKNEEFLYNIARTYLMLTKEFSEFYKEFKFTPAKFNALVLIEHLGKEDGVSQIEISEKLIVTGANITGLIDRLEKDKLVVRIPDVKDRRSNRIKITKKGEELIEKIWSLHIEKTNSLVKHISNSRKNEVIGCLTEIRERLGKEVR